jgi:uncharacterized membrane protein YuzA (DUF378 family)
MAKGKMKWYDLVSIVLLIVGGIAWGLVGFFNFNLVNWIFGTGMWSKGVFDLVGIASVYSIYSLWKAK